MLKKLLLLLTLFFVTPALCMEIEDTVTIQTQEATDFKVPVDLVQLSGTLYDVIDYVGTDNVIPLPNINSATWRLIEKLLERVYKIRKNIGKVKQCKQEIINAYKELDGQQLIDLIIAVNYLDIPELLEIATDIAKNNIEKISLKQINQLSKDIAVPIVNAALKLLGPVPAKQLAQENYAKLDDSTVCYAPDGSRRFQGWLEDDFIHVQDVQSKKELTVYEGHAGPVTAICITADGKYIISGSLDKTVRIWDTTTGKQIAQCNGHAKIITSVCVTKDNTIISSSSDGTIRVWDLMTGQQIVVYNPNATVVCLCVTGDGSRLIAGTTDKTVGVWDLTTRQLIAQCTGHADLVLSVSFVDGQIVSNSRDNTTRIWDISLLNRLKALNKTQIKAIWQYLKEVIKTQNKENCWQRIQDILDGDKSDGVQPRLKRVKTGEGEDDV